jgi:polyhydroxyalkanoate synthesis regulator phasin
MAPNKNRNTRQVRPLIGLSPEQVQLAWQRAVEKAGSRKIAASIVKAAMQGTSTTRLCTGYAGRKPDHESQLRPLGGLAPEEAKLAREHVVKKAEDARITATMVRRAVDELQPPAASKPVARRTRATKTKQRRAIDRIIRQLLMLVSQKTSHEILTEKVEVLHRHIQALFAATSKP